MAARKKSTRRVSKTAPSESFHETVITPVSENNRPGLKKFALPLGILAVLVLLYSFKGLFIAALVNGQPIGRFTVIGELEKQAGKRTLENIIVKALIVQEAKKKNVTIGQKEVDDQIKKIEKNVAGQGMNIDQLLAAQGMKKSDFQDELKLQLTVQKLVGGVTVTDKEIAEYKESNKDQPAQIPGQEPPKLTDAQIKEQLTQQKLQQKSQEYVGNLRKNAKVAYFTSY